MPEIRIDVGVDTILDVDLSAIDFSSTKEVVFTIKNNLSVDEKPVFEKSFTSSGKHKMIINAKESLCIQDGAAYDFQQVLVDGTRIKLTDNGLIRLRISVGDKID